MNLVAVAVALASAMSIPPMEGASAGIHAYESKTCGFRVEYPASWQAVPGLEAKLHYGGDYSEPTPCAVGLLPPGWEAYRHSSDFPLSEFPVTIVLKDVEFRDAAFQAGFRRVGDLRRRMDIYAEELGADDWVYPFLQANVPAQWIRTPCCRGLMSYGASHAYGKTAGKLTVESKAAILNNRRGRSVVVRTEDLRYEGSFDLVVHSFAFLDQAPK